MSVRSNNIPNKLRLVLRSGAGEGGWNQHAGKHSRAQFHRHERNGSQNRRIMFTLCGAFPGPSADVGIVQLLLQDGRLLQQETRRQEKSTPLSTSTCVSDTVAPQLSVNRRTCGSNDSLAEPRHTHHTWYKRKSVSNPERYVHSHLNMHATTRPVHVAVEHSSAHKHS